MKLKTSFLLIFVTLCFVGLLLFMNRTVPATADNVQPKTNTVSVPTQLVQTLNPAIPGTPKPASSSAMNEKPINTPKSLLESDLIQIAFSEAKKVTEIPANVQPKVTYEGDTAKIIWYINWPPEIIYPRGEYHALVKLDRRSGKILQIIGPP